MPWRLECGDLPEVRQVTLICARKLISYKAVSRIYL